MSDIIHELTQRLIDFREARNWKQFHNPKDCAISLNLEASEFLEHFQWKNGDELAQYLATHKEDVADELADVLYWVLLLAHDLDIDLATALPAKLEKAALKYPVDKSYGNHKKYTEL